MRLKWSRGRGRNYYREMLCRQRHPKGMTILKRRVGAPAPTLVSPTTKPNPERVEPRLSPIHYSPDATVPGQHPGPHRFLHAGSPSLPPRAAAPRGTASLSRRNSHQPVLPASDHRRHEQSRSSPPPSFPHLRARQRCEGTETRLLSLAKNQGAGPGRFRLASGYGIFSIGISELGTTRNYIANQEEHHRTITFQDELREIFRRHAVDFDERYVWD